MDEVRGSPKIFSEEKKDVRSISDFVDRFPYNSISGVVKIFMEKSPGEFKRHSGYCKKKEVFDEKIYFFDLTK